MITAIREDILDMVIKKKHWNVDEWRKKMLEKDFDTQNHPRIGQLRILWKDIYHFDLDNKVHPLLFRIVCAFLDQGIAIESLPGSSKGFTESIRDLERNGMVSFFRTKAAREKFVSGEYLPDTTPLR